MKENRAVSRKLNYIDRKYKPKNDEIVALFRVDPGKGIPFKIAADNVALESSIGTWTDVSTVNPKTAKKLKPHVFYLNEKSKLIKVAYPLDLFEQGNVSQILSSIAGNIFGMKLVNSLRLEDIEFPKKYLKSFKGPKFGMKGVRKLVNIKERPLVGTIVKPKLGLNSSEHAKVAYNAWLGGCDIVKDDENLTSMAFNKFNERIRKTIKLRDKCEKETGMKKIYMPNVTAETNEMLKRAEFVKKMGCEYAMVDCLTVGFSALQTLRQANEDLKLILHSHRAMHAALTRNKKHGISMHVLAKLNRLIGVDQLHIGTVVGKMEGGKKEVVSLVDEMEKQKVKENLEIPMLKQDWHGMKEVFAVSSGGLHPGMVPYLVKHLGKDIIIQMGGGIHGHSKGTIAGARAARQAVDATMQKIKLKDYAKTHEELKLALKNWKAIEVY